MRIAKYVAAATLIGGPAHASWLDSAWDAQAVEANLAPAITLGAAGVLLVLPQETLDAAHAAGLSISDAVKQLVERYGQHCSDVIDLDQPHQHLRVQLFIAKRVAVAAAPASVQGEVRDALKSRQSAPPPETLAVTPEESSELFIDYVPARTAHCSTPGGTISGAPGVN
jgi:hypothetical protein